MLCLVPFAVLCAMLLEAPLSRANIVERALLSAPTIQIAQGKLREAQALHVGAGALANSNPDLSVVAGPDYTDPQHPGLEIMATLQWPFDVAGTRHARQQAADAAEELAQSELRMARRDAVALALAQALRVRWSAARAALEHERAELDADFLRLSQVRREAGTVGDGDVALAKVLAAASAAQERQAKAAQKTAEALLRQALGMGPDEDIALLNDAPAPPVRLPDALKALPRRADLLRNRAQIIKTGRDVSLEDRMGVPQPQLYLEGGRMPEWYAEAGINVALPIYQRNQTARAVAEARVLTSEHAAQVQERVAEADVYAAYETYAGAMEALDSLQHAAPEIEDASHLAMRAYELGQSTLAQVVVTRREALTARRELLDATWAVEQAHLSLEIAAGMSL